jgi:hypothetical protein
MAVTVPFARLVLTVAMWSFLTPGRTRMRAERRSPPTVGGAGTKLKVMVPAGTYAISAEGCFGYKIENVSATVTSGFHAAVNLGSRLASRFRMILTTSW